MNYHYDDSFHEESGIKPQEKDGKKHTCGTYLLPAARLANKLQFPYVHNGEQILLKDAVCKQTITSQPALTIQNRCGVSPSLLSVLPASSQRSADHKARQIPL